MSCYGEDDQVITGLIGINLSFTHVFAALIQIYSKNYQLKIQFEVHLHPFPFSLPCIIDGQVKGKNVFLKKSPLIIIHSTNTHKYNNGTEKKEINCFLPFMKSIYSLLDDLNDATDRYYIKVLVLVLHSKLFASKNISSTVSDFNK